MSSAEKALAEIGFSKDRIQHLFNNVERNGIFWHRWKTKTLKPGAWTDELIQKFRTEILRNDAAELLAAVDLEGFCRDMKDLAGQYRTLNRQRNKMEIETETDMIELAGELLINRQLMDAIRQKSAGSWYKTLDQLF